MRTGQASEEDVKQRRDRAMQDPEVQRILTDPVMRQVQKHPCIQAFLGFRLLISTLCLCQRLKENAQKICAKNGCKETAFNMLWSWES